jgi:hypothetical protein
MKISLGASRFQKVLYTDVMSMLTLIFLFIAPAAQRIRIARAALVVIGVVITGGSRSGGYIRLLAIRSLRVYRISNDGSCYRNSFPSLRCPTVCSPRWGSSLYLRIVTGLMAETDRVSAGEKLRFQSLKLDAVR